MNLLGALLIVLFGFLFVTVSSRLTGEIGSSSNPISGMTVATLLLTCLIFLLLGWTGRRYYVTALSVGAIVCIAASNGGTTSQDLKTGFLVGATPRLQQIAILIGALASALLLGPILLKLNEAATVYVPGRAARAARRSRRRVDERARRERTPERPAGARATRAATGSGTRPTPTARPPASTWSTTRCARRGWSIRASTAPSTRVPTARKVKKFDAPKATLMSYIIKGILDRKLPWGLVLFGALIAVVLELSRHPVARVRGRRVPAHLVVDADLDRRTDPLPGRPARTTSEPRARADRGRSRSPRATAVRAC